ncbi:L,D-transpeptidase family protein [Wenzhouxiangella sp. AB-CW3]|uniref:L,D-transpeptidase family protein n=1 Tax=Wenzhouxiangella sp. AB-CW3 TaxID=2771012 RepID=UPI00168A7C5F|nr:L,D-transpeptidase family protein [Wenzhouxiangella sp. AB-CW3]QOC22110.1 L,D-transpeptidase family protein [Wenzhouxiangella sp. AB-CW3]
MPVAWSGAGETFREELRQRLERPHEIDAVPVAGSMLMAHGPLRSVYEANGWEPLWFERLEPVDQLRQVPATLELAASHGLEPDHYHREALTVALQGLRSSSTPNSVPALVDVELMATDALLALAHHLAHGRIDPESIDPEWFIEREQPTLTSSVMRHALGGKGGRELLETLLPSHPAYHRLVEQLALKRELADNGEWLAVDAALPLIRPGDSDERIPAIRRHLARLERGEAVPADSKPQYFDDALEQAVRAFQQRHGLAVDGIIGPQTLNALNVPPTARVEQLRANLERWRWLPQSLGEEYVLVNIAGFGMQVVSNGEEVMRQRVIVGQPYRRTPVFTGRMSYLVLNPSWEVPPRLAVRDQLPRIRANPDYLADMGFAVLQGWGAEERRIDPADVDWNSLSPRNFPYRLRQAPGPDNALGRVKFMFPNRHNVYLHDTPARELFGQHERAFSSGCIRLEDADELARWLLTQRSDLMSKERIESTWNHGRETTVRLDRHMPVYLLYWTAWVGDDNQVHFRRDIYQRDQRLIEALNTPPPGPESPDITLTRGYDA